jgi:hypothetical protein
VLAGPDTISPGEFFPHAGVNKTAARKEQNIFLANFKVSPVN